MNRKKNSSWLVFRLISTGKIFLSFRVPCFSFFFQSLLAGGNFSLAILLMAITNFAGVFSVAPMLIWMTDLSSGVNVNRFGNIMIVFALVTVLPTIVSISRRAIEKTLGWVTRAYLQAGLANRVFFFQKDFYFLPKQLMMNIHEKIAVSQCHSVRVKAFFPSWQLWQKQSPCRKNVRVIFFFASKHNFFVDCQSLIYCFCPIMSCHCSRKLMPLFKPIRCKIAINVLGISCMHKCSIISARFLS